MAFRLQNLAILTYAQGYTGWHYSAVFDKIEDVKSPGYFSAARDMISPGDTITVSARDGVGLFGVKVGGEISAVTFGTVSVLRPVELA